MSTASNDQLSKLARNAAEILPAGALEAKLDTGRPLRVKLGLDPTAEHVTLGWAVVLRKLKDFQDAGHQAVLIVGDFTARIGDPSDKENTRPMLSKERVDAYAQRVLDQFFLILDRDRTEVRRNSEWLEDLGVQGFLELATHQTVAHTLQRDDFANRYAAGTPISLREFVYPLLQGYDSVAVESDIELGGTDQHFNLLVGRDLQRAHEQEPQAILTMPLLEGTDGVKKMGQSLGNYIGVTEPPDEQFGKLMRVPDHLMEKYFRLTTDRSDRDTEELLKSVETGDVRPEQAKRELASDVVRLYHGAQAATAARERFDKLFVDKQVPEDVEEAPIPSGSVNGTTVYVPGLLKELGLASSSSEAGRLIAQGGVHLDGETLTEPEIEVDSLRGKLLQVGKRRFVRLR